MPSALKFMCFRVSSPTTKCLSESPVFANRVRENGRSTQVRHIVGSRRNAWVVSWCRFSTTLTVPTG